MTIAQLVQGFRGWLDSTGHTSANSRWSPELIYSRMLMFRSTLLSMKLKNGEDISYENKKIIPCIPLVKADKWECPCAPASGCSFRKTKIPLIRYIWIEAVSSIGGEINYDFVEWNEFEDKLKHRIPALAREAYWTHKTIGDETYHYLYNDNHKKFLTYTIIPYDPIEYALMPDCKGNVNWCLDAFQVKFPMDMDSEVQLFEGAFNLLVNPRPKDADIFDNSIQDTPGVPLR